MHLLFEYTGEPTGGNRGTEFSLPLVSSSSFETEGVLKSRMDAFLALNPKTREDFVAYQTNSGKPAIAFTPRMNRPDAQTWSRSGVDVSRDGIVFKYMAELPDLSGEGVAFETYLDRS